MAEDSILGRLIAGLTFGQFGPGAPQGQLFAKSFVVILFGVPAMIGWWVFWSSHVTKAIETTRSKAPTEQSREVDRVGANKEFQTGLRRLGCYDGGIDGIWGEGSKQALTDMIDALGRTDDFPGTKVDHSDIRSMLAQAPSHLCTKWRQQEAVNSARSEYASKLVSYRAQCQLDILGTALHFWSGHCGNIRADLKSARDKLQILQENQ